MKELEIAKDVILSYLGRDATAAGVYAIFEINHGNKEELLGHINALIGIFEKARDELVGDYYEESKNKTR